MMTPLKARARAYASLGAAVLLVATSDPREAWADDKGWKVTLKMISDGAGGKTCGHDDNHSATRLRKVRDRVAVKVVNKCPEPREVKLEAKADVLTNCDSLPKDAATLNQWFEIAGKPPGGSAPVIEVFCYGIYEDKKTRLEALDRARGSGPIVSTRTHYIDIDIVR